SVRARSVVLPQRTATRMRRANSSAGSERLPYTQDVGGSNPSSPIAGRRWRLGMHWKTRRRAGMLLATIAPSAFGQLAIQQPTVKLMMPPLTVTQGADSATSVAVMDAAREKLATLARYKLIVIAKPKLCEALKASGFPCDVLLDDAQARLL